MNYPPGVTTGMIPGWRKEDVEDDMEDERLDALAEKAWPAYAETICESDGTSVSAAMDVCDDAADVLEVAARLSARLKRDLT